MANIFGFLYLRCTLAPLDEYDWIVRVRRRCGLMSNYFDHLLSLLTADLGWHTAFARSSSS